MSEPKNPSLIAREALTKLTAARLPPTPANFQACYNEIAELPNLPAFQMPGNRTGTANYMAPELIKRQHTDERIDIFSFSVTCFEICSTSRLI